jgi:propanol-preferring alcohol dehydrogenase
MRAMVLREFGGPLRLEEVPRPAIGPRDALLRVRACAADQFDVTIRAGKWPSAKLPLILGHEVSGEVAEVGAEVRNVRPGDRVCSTLYLTCGECRYCRIGRETLCLNFGGHLGAEVDGGYAEYLCVPAANLVHVSRGVSFEEASILANALGTPYHAIKERARVQPGQVVVVVGAGGGVGLHAVQIAQLFGARVIAADITREKREKAKELGAEEALDPREVPLDERVLKLTGGEGADAVIQLVGGETFGPSLRSLRPGGRLVIIGSHTGTEVPLPALLMLTKELEVLGSRNVTKTELAEVVRRVEAGRLKPIVTETYPLEELERALERVAKSAVIGRAVVRL